MAFLLKFFFFGVFLLLSLILCHSKNMTVKVFGQIHCKDRHEFSNSRASSGFQAFIHCNTEKIETSTQGNSPVDSEGKFNVTLSDDNTESGYTIDHCFAKLQTLSNLPCPIKTTQTASLKICIIKNKTAQEYQCRPVIVKFPPVTCKSAFFIAKPKSIFSHTPHLLPLPGPPMGNARPPVSPPENLIPPPKPRLYLLLRPALVFQSLKYPPSNPTTESLSPSPTPIYNKPTHIPPINGPIAPPFFKHLPKTPTQSQPFHHPPPKAFHQMPYQPNPIPPSFPPTNHKKPHLVTPNPAPIPIPKHLTPLASSPSPSPSPYHDPPRTGPEKSHPPHPNHRKSNPLPRVAPVPQLPPIPPSFPPTHHKKTYSVTPAPAPAPISKPRKPLAPSPNPSSYHHPPPPEPEKPIPPPPNQRKSNPIPRPPPLPQLPPIPPVPRKYFNPQPPQSS